MRAGGRGLLALVLAAVAVAGAVAADRLGPATRPSSAAVAATSGIWLCPHGGGKDWSATIAIANPGTSNVDVRLTPIGSGAPGAPISVAVPPGREVLQPMPATQRGSATYVEAFGGWVGVGWAVTAGGSESGVGTEPCAPGAGTSWYTTDADTSQGRQAFLVMMNPFAQDAVYDVTLFQPGRPPTRPEGWNGAVLPAGRSVALELDKQVLGRDPVAAQVDISKGKVAVGSLGVRSSGGVRSVLGATALSSTWYLPVAGGVGQSSLAMFVPEDDGALFSGMLLSSQPAQSAGNLTEMQQSGRSTGSYQVLTSGASAIQITTDAAVPVLAALRATGQTVDDAATGGVTTPAPAWLVPPTVRAAPAKPGLVLVNPGPDPVDVTLQLLPEGRSDPGDPVTLTIPGQRAVGAPASFLGRDPLGAVLVRATGDIVALGASTSGGRKGLALYGLAVGVAVPAVALPAD
jgi:hypothetical protein